MKQRQMRLLIVCLGLVGLVVVGVLVVPRKGAEPSTQQLLPILAQRINDAAAIELRSGSETLTLERSGEGWVIPSKTSLPARMDKIRPLLVALSEMKALDEKTSNPEMYARIGVAEPGSGGQGTLVTVTSASGEKLASIIVGIATREGTAEQRYVRLPADSRSWLVPATVEVTTDPINWIVRELTRIDGSRVQSLNVIHPDGDEIGLSRADTAQPNFDVAPVPEGFELRSAGIADPMSRALTSLNFDDVRPAAGKLFGSPVEVVFQMFDGLVVSIQIYDHEGEKWAVFDANSVNADIVPDQLETLQARFKGREFMIPGWAATNLSRRMSELTEPKAAPSPQPETDSPRGSVLE